MMKKSGNLSLIFTAMVLFFGFLSAPVLAVVEPLVPRDSIQDIKLIVPTSTPTPTTPIYKLNPEFKPEFEILPTVVANTATPVSPTPTPTTAISPAASGTPAVAENVEEAVEPTEAVTAEPTEVQTAKTALIGTKEAVFIGTIALLLVIIVLQGRPKKETKEESQTE
ncbi:MAG TPA: hypothetical protein PKI75_02805 [Candidatus Woesebacteria bacterium]|nr:hypothetical protein [Candidatus Woesebacteria bacterium]